MPKLEPGSIGWHAIRAGMFVKDASHKADTGWNTDAIKCLAEAIKELSLAIEKIERKLEEK